MSPRGVAMPDVRQRLFAAAERVLAREGPGGLTSRAITAEAGCAKGMLHRHFADLDAFVAELVLDRLGGVAAQVADLPARAGQGTVTENLADAVERLLMSDVPALADLAMSRAGVAAHVRRAMREDAPGFTAIEASLAAYLDAEKRQGRLAPGTDAGAAALAIVGTAHHLAMTGPPDPAERRRRLRRVVAAVSATT